MLRLIAPRHDDDDDDTLANLAFHRSSLSSSSRSQRRSTISPEDGLSPRGWQEQIQCRCGVGLSSAREDDQDDVSSPCQVNDRVLG